MPSLREGIVCEAPPAEVWRLVHDPERLGEWMADTARVEPGPDGTVTRYLHGWPDLPMPTRVRTRAEGERVVVSCLVSDIDVSVSLAPHPRGCAVEMAIRLPEGESARLDAMRGLAVASLERLAARSAAGAGAAEF